MALDDLVLHVGAVPGFAEAARFWIRLGFISFGGPAGQIAIMHREIVDRRRWLDEVSFTHALNFCMLLPGPEALQLAIFLGWKMHGVRGGLVAGLGFVLPAIVLLFGLSVVYVLYGTMHWLAGVLFGLKVAVVALVAQALLRIGVRALRTPLHQALAVGAFVALEFLGVPFPLIVLAAALAGGWATRHDLPVRAASQAASVRAYTLRVVIVGFVLWAVPLALLAASVGLHTLWSSLYLFFTKAAFVTFGGAYAVLGYVTERLVDGLGWVTAAQSVDGLALAETTPGPLIIVLQFMGFMAGWNEPGDLTRLGSALLAGVLASWATFLPSFVFILVGAPHVERLTSMPRVAGALAGVTAAVVGVIATLALLLAQVVFFPDGWPAWPDWRAVLLCAATWFALERLRWSLVPVLCGASVSGLLLLRLFQ